MCIQKTCARCKANLAGLGNLLMCNMKRFSFPNVGQACPNLRRLDQDPRIQMCHECTTSSNCGHFDFDIPDFPTGTVSKEGVSAYRPIALSGKQDAFSSNSPEIINKDRRLSYEVARGFRRLQVCDSAQLHTFFSDLSIR